MSRIVLCDCETGGLDPAVHPMIQFAAIAVDLDWKELETLEVKLRFDPAKADPEALKLNHFDPAVWEREAIEPAAAVKRIGQFLREHATTEMVSQRTGRPYKVATLAGHNVQFDAGFLQALFKAHGAFVPASYRVMDTCSLALWTYHGRADAPKTFKLGELAKHLGVELEGAHDALADVRATVAVARALLAMRGAR